MSVQSKISQMKRKYAQSHTLETQQKGLVATAKHVIMQRIYLRRVFIRDIRNHFSQLYDYSSLNIFMILQFLNICFPDKWKLHRCI